VREEGILDESGCQKPLLKLRTLGNFSARVNGDLNPTNKTRLHHFPAFIIDPYEPEACP
jgi:hypothetical protein